MTDHDFGIIKKPKSRHSEPKSGANVDIGLFIRNPGLEDNKDDSQEEADIIVDP